MQTIDEGVMMDIMRAYQQMRSRPRQSCGPKLDDTMRLRLVNTMKKVNDLVNHQLVQMQDSYADDGGFLLSLTAVNQNLSKNSLYGSLLALDEFYDNLKRLNKRNRDGGREEVLNTTLVEELDELRAALAAPKPTTAANGPSCGNNATKRHLTQEEVRSFICG